VYPHFRVLIETPDGKLRPLLWFDSHKENELVWAPYGLSRKQSVLTYEWPEQNVPRNTKEEYRYYFRERMRRDLPLNHITSHLDGTFHVKSTHEPPIYIHRMRRTEPLGPQTNVFLECIVVSDVGMDYRADSRKLKLGSVSLPVPLGSGLRIHMAFSGRDFPLESAFKHEPKYEKLRREVTVGNFKAVFVASYHRPDVELTDDRTKGTLISFRFPLARGGDRLKNFIFE
jgi:hypothetical protein